MTDDLPDRRPAILDVLELLSSPEQQLLYEARVPVAFIPDELVCLWFDDQYQPDDAFFRSCFTATELALLAEFDAVYESLLVHLPEPSEGVATWHASEAWSRVMAAAAATLRGLRGDGTRGGERGTTP